MSTETEGLHDFRQLEQMYAEKPAAYRRMVARWIALGYGYVVVTILSIVVFVGGGALLFATGKISLLWADNFAKIGIPLLIVAGLMLRAVFTRLPKPEGHYLEAPLKDKVLAAFEDVRLAAGGQSIDEVVIVNELNAAVIQMPRFGLFGPATNYLILGAPLLQSMTLEEVRAVVAHEFGHLSHAHGRMGSVVYRLDQTLRNAAIAIQQKGRSGFQGVSFRFLDWFYRRFNQVTFAMRRGQEYEADRVSASATSAPALASALCKLNALDGPLDEFWNSVWRRTRTHEDNADIFPQSELQSFIFKAVQEQPTRDAVERALEQETNFADSHPCLRERLQALETPAVTSFEFRSSALDELLTDAERREFLKPLDQTWHTASGDNWRAAHEDFLASKKELEELRARQDLARDGLFRRAWLAESIDGIDSARGDYQTLVEATPDDPVAQYHWGRVNIGSDVAVGQAALLRAAELDIESYPGVAQLIGGDGPDEVKGRMETLRQRYEEIIAGANAERESVSVNDELSAVEFNEEFRAALVEFAGQFTEIRRVFLVEKQVQHLKDNRVFLLGFDINHYHDDVERKLDRWLGRITNEFATAFPALNSPFAVLVDKKSPWVAKLEGIEGALVYTGTGKKPRSFFGMLKTGLIWLIVLIIAIYLLSQLMG